MTITVEELVQREVICCVSSLFSDVLTLVQNADYDTLHVTNFDLDELQDLQQRLDYEAAGDEHIDNMDRDELIEALSDADVEDERDGALIVEKAHDDFVAGMEDGDIDPAEEDVKEWVHDRMKEWPGISDDDLRAKLKEHLGSEDDGYKDFCDEHSIDIDEYIDVYEHWAVTSWFADKLRAKGEIVGDFGNLTVWGRTCTGQAISMDWVVQEIHKELIA